jgi:hypothetical protein
MEFSNEAALLQEIYKGGEMGTQSISYLLPKVKNAAFRSDLQTQNEQYTATCKQAEAELAKSGLCPQQLSSQQQSMLQMSLWSKTVLNHETSHLAKIMIEGSNMGILTLTGILNTFGDSKDNPAQSQTEAQFAQQANNPAVRLARETIQHEKDNIDRLKVYLQ